MKVSEEEVGEIVDPDIDRGGTNDFVDRAFTFLRGRIPEMAKGKVVGSTKCLYCNTPDDHFLIDWAPGHKRVLVASGGSGHGFKFGGSIGPVIADALEDAHNPLGDLFRIGDRLKPDAEIGRIYETRGFSLPKESVR